MNSATSIFATESVSAVAPKVGDILMGTYGYDASIPTFAKVLAVTGKSIRVVELAGQNTGYKTGGMEWTVVVTDKPVGKVSTKRIQAHGNGYRVKWNSYQNLYGPWTPKPVSAYNYH